MQIRFSFRVEDLDRNAYNFAFNISEKHDVIEMRSNSNLNDVGLFIASLLSFNDLNLNAEFVNSLYIQDELALEGGLLFKANDIYIGASCCLDFQDWINVVKEIKTKKSPWMGHDPSPWFEFNDKNIILWSDEQNKIEIGNFDCIQFTLQEFDRELLEAKKELNQFLHIVDRWASENYSVDAEKLTLGIKHYLLI